MRVSLWTDPFSQRSMKQSHQLREQKSVRSEEKVQNSSENANNQLGFLAVMGLSGGLGLCLRGTLATLSAHSKYFLPPTLLCKFISRIRFVVSSLEITDLLQVNVPPSTHIHTIE